MDGGTLSRVNGNEHQPEGMVCIGSANVSNVRALSAPVESSTRQTACGNPRVFLRCQADWYPHGWS